MSAPTSYEEALLDAWPAVYWDESAFLENGEAALSDGFTPNASRTRHWVMTPTRSSRSLRCRYRCWVSGQVQLNDGGTTVDPSRQLMLQMLLVTQADLAAAETDLVTATATRDAAQAAVDAAPADSAELEAAQGH